jgi:hypothetical protein
MRKKIFNKLLNKHHSFSQKMGPSLALLPFRLSSLLLLQECAPEGNIHLFVALNAIGTVAHLKDFDLTSRSYFKQRFILPFMGSFSPPPYHQ